MLKLLLQGWWALPLVPGVLQELLAVWFIMSTVHLDTILHTKHLGSPEMAWQLVRLHAQVQYPHRQDGQDGKLWGSMPRSDCLIKSSSSASTPSRLEVIAFDLYRTVQHGTEVISIPA